MATVHALDVSFASTFLGPGGPWQVPQDCRDEVSLWAPGDDADLKIGAWTHGAQSEATSGTQLGLQKGGG